MKAAIVEQPDRFPVYGEFPEPVARPDEVVVQVTASALSQIARGRAAGTHYSARGGFPSVVGVDGVGRMEDGRRVYFALPRAPFGAMAERTVGRSEWTVAATAPRSRRVEYPLTQKSSAHGR